MTKTTPLKVLIYLCGDAAQRLPGAQPPESVDLQETIGLNVPLPSLEDVAWVVQMHRPALRQALRLVQQPGDSRAHLVSVVEDVQDSPAARDGFAAWAMARYPSQRTLLLMGDCSAAPGELQPRAGTAFQVVSSPDGPDQWPLGEVTLEEILSEDETRGPISALLAKLMAFLLGKEPIGPDQPREPEPDRPITEPPSPDPSAPEEDTNMPPQRDWTILLYMAGDNGKRFEKIGGYSLMAEMTSAGYEDLAEIEQAGTTDHVAVLAQLDTLDGGTYRFDIRAGQNSKENQLPEVFEVNTGDPAGLAQFIVWGMSRAPARHTMLVLWNHGMGWKDDDIYHKVRAISRSARAGYPSRNENAALFQSVAQEAYERAQQEPDENARAILCDDSSLDFLTNQEMSQALRVAEVAADETEVAAIFQDKERLARVMAGQEGETRRHLNVIGMDACLMAMLEVQYQVRNFADVMVGSQAVEPMKGWPYTAIVEKLTANPAMSPRELSFLIVDEYKRSYFNKDITQSAVDLATLEQGRELVGAFAAELAERYAHDEGLQSAYAQAQMHARRPWRRTRGDDPEYVDLKTFIGLLMRHYGEDGHAGLRRAGQDLLTWLDSSSGPVINSQATGNYGSATGISIYLSEQEPSPLYADLDFAASGWLQFLKAISSFQPSL